MRRSSVQSVVVADQGDSTALLDLTPMIDVIFLLIIFWMTVTAFSPAQPVRQLELPAATVRQSAGAGNPLIFDVTAEPVRPIHHAGRAWSVGELDAHLSEAPAAGLAGRDVVIRADRRADARLVSDLARRCYLHGAGSVAFSLRAKGGGA